MKLRWRRILAWLIDCACILAWVAVTAAVGIPLYLTGVTESSGMLMANLISALVMVVPVVVAAAWCESRPGAGTPGKRVLHLRLFSRSAPPRFQTTLARNLLKIGLPWILGHAAVYAIVASSQGSAGVPFEVWALTGAAYVIPIIYTGSLFLADGRTPYDRVTGTNVELLPKEPVDGASS